MLTSNVFYPSLPSGWPGWLALWFGLPWRWPVHQPAGSGVGRAPLRLSAELRHIAVRALTSPTRRCARWPPSCRQSVFLAPQERPPDGRHVALLAGTPRRQSRRERGVGGGIWLF